MEMTPYKLDTPAVVSFSGGRTSGYMLRHIIDAFGGTLPDDVKVIFNNTGKERPETLDFVELCSQEWNVPVIWLEYRYIGKPMEPPAGGLPKTPGRHTFVEVNYATASRNGEPLEQVITARGMLPNVMARFCTVECKIRTTSRYLKSLGWKEYTNAIGFRADEPQRVAKLATTNRHGKEEPVAPLHKMGVTKKDIHDWWDRQPFKLELQDHEGNCDLCFLKGAGKIREIIRRRPDLAEWWIRMEEKIKGGRSGTARFRIDRPRYKIQLEMAHRPGLFDVDPNEADELSIACTCSE